MFQNLTLTALCFLHKLIGSKSHRIFNDEEFPVRRHLRLATLFVMFLVLSLAFTGLPLLKPISGQPDNRPVVGIWGSTYSTWNITDPTLVVGSTFLVQVNVTNAPPFNGYEFALFFDPAFIQVKNYDLSSGIFPSPYPAIEFNGNGSLRLSVVNTGQLITAGFGPLLSITFIVIKAGGVSPLAFAAPAMTPSNFAQPPDVVCRNCPAGTPNWTRLVAGSTPIDVQTSDGYFDNVLGSSNPYGPTADFKFTPSNPFQGETVKFNATASFDPDNRAAQNNGISEYIWDFGDKSSQPYVTSISPIV